ncbi:hypothetical protein F7Q99_33020 [Streptomyces kaniharaensis]|uniref:Uncharacterized protein n=1 Tax=Streptomyces kaniharaensis TaxID=212423 RepID=A0A6N7KZ15_9ACTN|nr:hypothetical protein [Streptomyces kaniharaensis]MQS16882.1 hypothetical protein [Streptomyces kaniharaensis]
MPPLTTGGRAEVSVSDPGELRSLRKHLRRIPGVVDVDEIAGPPARAALLIVTADRGTLTRAVRTLPAYIRSRRSRACVTVRAADWTITLHADGGGKEAPGRLRLKRLRG